MIIKQLLFVLVRKDLRYVILRFILIKIIILISKRILVTPKILIHVPEFLFLKLLVELIVSLETVVILLISVHIIVII